MDLIDGHVGSDDKTLACALLNSTTDASTVRLKEPMRPSRRSAVAVSTPKYSALWKTRPGKLVSFSRRNLGDKLQRLYSISPSHLGAVEILVDSFLKDLSQGKRDKLKKIVTVVLACHTLVP